jgi:phage tail tape-measure protein
VALAVALAVAEVIRVAVMDALRTVCSKDCEGNIFLLGEIGDAARTVKEMLFGWQQPLIEAMSKMQNTRILLQGLEKDAKNPQDAAEKDMNFIMGLSEKVHVSLDAVSDAFVKLKSGGIDPTTGSLNALVNSVAQFGGDSKS